MRLKSANLPPLLSPRRLLGTGAVAKRHGVPLHVALYWMQHNNFLPGSMFNEKTKRWGVPHMHAVIDPALRPVWGDMGTWTRPPTGKPRGRPKGVKNSRPYPTGVKRPRKPK